MIRHCLLHWQIIVRNDTEDTSVPQECPASTKVRDDSSGEIVEDCSATCYDTYGPIPLFIGPGDTQHNGPGRIWRYIRPVNILPFRK